MDLDPNTLMPLDPDPVDLTLTAKKVVDKIAPPLLKQLDAIRAQSGMPPFSEVGKPILEK